MKGYLNIQNHNGHNVYYLNKEGRELIGSETEVKWTLQAEHHIMRNDVYIHYGCPKDWKVEYKIIFEPKGMRTQERTVIPDALFTKDGLYHLVEIDRTQSMADNKKKIEQYGELSVIMADEFGHAPRIIFYTLTEHRRKKLEDLCQHYKVACTVFTKEDLF